jgi:hypothetical protein
VDNIQPIEKIHKLATIDVVCKDGLKVDMAKINLILDLKPHVNTK